MIKVVDGAPTPYSIRQLKADNPNVSFPRNPSDEILSEYDVFRVQNTAPPETGPDERAVLGDPTLEGGQWVQTWQVVPIPQEELEQRARDQREQSRNETRQKLSESLALERAATIVKDESTDFATITDLAPALDDWEPGLIFIAADDTTTEVYDGRVGDVLYYGGTAVEVLQPHTSQDDWLPPDVPALYEVYRDPDSAEPWVQPEGAHDAYALGEEVTHNGRLWSSEVDDNVWEPGVFGWADLGTLD